MVRQPTKRVPVRLPQLSASVSSRANWLRSIRLSGFTIAMLTVLILTVVVLAPSLRIFVEQQQEITQLRAELESQKSDLKNLKDQRARWDDPHYIETQARARLDYVYPGEYSYMVIDDGKTITTSDGQPISDSVQSTRVDWVKVLLSSILTAGLTDQAPGKIVAPALDDR